MMPMGVILFPSVHFALRAEKLVKEKGISHKLIPVPRHLSSDCGVCLRMPWDKKEEIVSLLEQNGVKIEAVQPLSEKNK